MLELPPPLGTVDYAVWAYQREMDRANLAEVPSQTHIFIEPSPWEAKGDRCSLGR
jgi:hypothetical protein